MNFLAFVVLALVAFAATPAGAQTAEQPIYDRRIACRELPFPVWVICLAARASYIEPKWCAEIGQTAFKPAGQQCDPGRAGRTVSISQGRS